MTDQAPAPAPKPEKDERSEWERFKALAQQLVHTPKRPKPQA